MGLLSVMSSLALYTVSGVRVKKSISSGTEANVVGLEKPNFPLELMIRSSLFIPALLRVRVYSPGLLMESRTRKVPSGVSWSFADTSSLLGGGGRRGPQPQGGPLM